MSPAGLWMLVAVAVLGVTTGLPVWALLLGVASLGSIAAWLAGFDVSVIGAIGPRVINLLEHDLLQAMPLYVFVGVLLQRIAVADAVFATGERLVGAPIASLGVGALIAPMNGSVASSSALLSRLVAPRLHALSPPRAMALIAVAATIGVVVPPSLVLILLGDAMLRAHTEASNLPGFVLQGRIVNTQDILHAALPPAALVLLLWAFVAWMEGRAVPRAKVALSMRQVALAVATTASIVFLLGGVFVGRLFAVEAAATGGCVLAIGALVTRSLSARQWEEVLRDTLALSGALFALLVAATSFSLVFRVFGTDRWLADLVVASPFPPHLTAALVLVLVAVCALALDAFEMIFVVIPIVAPLLIAQLGDAQQVAVLLLFVLQLSFLLPPLGYAVIMTRARAGLPPVSNTALLRALAPFLVTQVAVGMLVFCSPRVTHWLDAPESAASDPSAPAASEDDIVKQMEEMARDPDEAASAARK
ncbi:MAG TPA: TRAP transporter large permease subunit [Ramlibacter sp.]|nr:TRAP transporter large permease subunit [Ramlibacter sp.]